MVPTLLIPNDHEDTGNVTSWPRHGSPWALLGHDWVGGLCCIKEELFLASGKNDNI